ncbi:hypothetical protein M1523_00130 [Patescibacteria group bacterium]|nr:hypothetical protein [Patescibacteria group bacterium]MCL5091956.1 hypothetical protein [Patescibacteria group bacterium]
MNKGEWFRFGFSTAHEAPFLSVLTTTNREAAINYLEKQLRAQLLHVSRNSAVSVPYSYWLGDQNQIYTDEARSLPLYLDTRERDGLYREGLIKAMKNAHTHPDQLQFLYSPPGIVDFSHDPDSPYHQPYDIGQLYLIWSDGERINNVAISLNREGGAWVKEIFGDAYFARMPGEKDEIARIKHFITNPVSTQMNLDDFLERPWLHDDKSVFYANNSAGEKNYTVNEIKAEMKQAFARQLGNDFDARSIAEDYVNDGGGADRLTAAYMEVYRYEMDRTGQDTIRLGGSCGGTVVSRTDLNNGNRSVMEQISTSSLTALDSRYRSSVQTKKWEYHTGDCVHCHAKNVDVGPCNICRNCERLPELNETD